MNKPEKLSLIIGGSILGGLVLGLAAYKRYKNNEAKKMDIVYQRDKNVGVKTLDTDANASDTDDTDVTVDLDDDDDDDASVLEEGIDYYKKGGKQKKSRRQKKKQTKNDKNRKRRSKKNKKSRK